jgi:VanZ family protein
MRKLATGFYVLYLLMITYFSLTPIEHEVTESIWDKASHFIAYLILFIIAKKVHTKFNYLTCAIICCIYAFGIECIQYFIPNRDFEGLDMIASSLGIFLGVIIYKLFIEKCFETRQNAT